MPAINNRVKALQGAYAEDTTAGKALAAMVSDLDGGKLHASTRKQIEAMQKDASFEGSTVMYVLQGALESFGENISAPDASEAKEG